MSDSDSIPPRSADSAYGSPDDDSVDLATYQLLQEQCDRAIEEQKEVEMQLADIRAKYRMTSKELEHKDAKLNSLEQRFQDAQAELKELKAQQEEIARELRQAERAGKDLAAERERVEREKAESRLEQLRADYESRIETLRRERERAVLDLDAARKEIDSRVSEADLLQHNLEEVMHATADHESAFLEERTRRKELQQSLEGVRSELTERIHALEAQLDRERANFLQQEQELCAIADQHRARAEEDRREREKYEAQLLGSRHETTSIQMELSQLRQDLERRTADLAAERERAEHLHETLSRTEEELVAEREHAEALNEELTHEQKLAEKMRSTFEVDLAKLRDQRDDLRDKLSSLEQTARERQDALAAVRQELDAAKRAHATRVSDLQGEVARQEKNHWSLSQQYDREKQRASELQKRLTEVELEYEKKRDALQAQADALVAQSEADRSEMTRFQTMLVEARHETQALTLKVEQQQRALIESAYEAKRARVDLVGELQQMTHARDDALAAVETARKEQSIEKRLLTNQVEQFRAQLRNESSLNGREKETLQKKLAAANDALESLRAQVCDHPRQLEALKKEQQEALAAMEQEIASQREALKRTATAFEEANRQNELLESEVTTARATLSEREVEIKALRTELEAAQSDGTEKSKRMHGLLAETQEELAALRTEAEMLRPRCNDAEALVIELRDENKSMKAQLDDLRETGAAASASKAYLKEKCEALEASLREAQTALEQEAERREALEVKLEHGRESVLRLERELEGETRAENDALQREIERLQGERNSLLEQVRVANDKAQEMTQRLQTVQEDVDQAHQASQAGKAFLKEKLSRAEKRLEKLEQQLAAARARNTQESRQKA